MVGKTILHYEIIEPLGAGGMGEVYRARDTKLERDVAIKVLPEDLADDPDRLARLQREAKLLAALNHPNIATVHALEGEEGASFLVLELVTGESLEQKLAKGPLPVEKALDICKQIAEALEAAHGAGIIHRDLKPANVLVTPDGRAKVLDFGIAKSMQVDAGVAATAHATNLTVAGTLVGTPSYMSPEQVRGGAIDKRVDIWAFGCLLFETLTARSAFAKETMADTLAAIVDQEPDWNALPNEISPQVRRLIERCLRKDPDGRLHDIADARIEIEEALSGGADATPATLAAPPDRGTTRVSPWTLAIPLAGASALLAALAVWVTIPRSQPLTGHFTIDYPTGSTLLQRTGPSVAISPDGDVVFGAERALWHRSLTELVATRIPGTEFASVPFYSPDGQRLGFWTGDGRALGMHGQMNFVDITGGQVDGDPVPLGPAERPYGASWADDGYIYFGQGAGGIWRVPADRSEEPLPIIDIDEGEQAHGPQLLPGGDWVLFTLATGADWNEAQIVVRSLATKEHRVLAPAGTDARYVSTGHIVYSRGGSLFAMRFDLDRMDVIGGEESINVGGVQQSLRDMVHRSIPLTGASQYAFSPFGALVYMPEAGAAIPQYPLVWWDREGTSHRVPLDPRGFWDPRLSPDDSLIAVHVDTDISTIQIGIYDIERGTFDLLTSEGSNTYPVWSSDGESVYFDSNRRGDRDIFSIGVDQSDDAILVYGGEDRQTPWSVRNGRLLFSDMRSEDTLSILPLDDTTLAATVNFDLGLGMYAVLSPDARYFVAADAGQVYIQEVSSRRRWQVGPGHIPMWSREGGEVYYWDGPPAQSVMYSVGVDTGAQDPIIGPPTELFEFERSGARARDAFDVTRDGQRFFMVGEETGTVPATQLVIVLNWFEELKRLVPTGR